MDDGGSDFGMFDGAGVDGLDEELSVFSSLLTTKVVSARHVALLNARDAPFQRYRQVS